MDESAITVRYARALFTLIKETNQLSVLKKDADLIAAVCSQSNDFIRLLNDPVVKSSEKIRVIRLIFANKIDPVTQNFLELILQNNREQFIPLIFRNIQADIRKAKNIRTAVVTTAQPVDEELLQKTTAILERALDSEVELTSRVNSNIIGGIILRIDDQQYDDSIATQLKRIKQIVLTSQASMKN
jgi:F-type H+-transporting ATPase subunit delta